MLAHVDSNYDRDPRRDPRRMQLAENLRKARQSLTPPLSQQRLGEASGVYYRTIQNIESCSVEAKDSTLIKLASALGTTIEALRGRLESAPASEFVDDFLMSDYARDMSLTPDEIAWLRELPDIRWAGRKPSNLTIYHLVAAYRSSKSPH